MTAEKKLTAHNATVTTATVEIKTLTVSGRQVTLAVFRQLIEEPILDRLTAEIIGNAWGSVNYHPDKCGDGPEHLHIVWQKGAELRRATIQAPNAGHHKHPAADLYVQSRILRRSAHSPDFEPQPGDPLRLSESIPGGRRIFSGGELTHGAMVFRGAVPFRLLVAWRAGNVPSGEDRHAFDSVASSLGMEGGEPSDQVERDLLSMLPVGRYRQSWAELAALPQLFIAV